MAERREVGGIVYYPAAGGGPDQFEGDKPLVSWVPEDWVERALAGREFASRKWTPTAHPRWPKGTPKGGKFMTKGEIQARLVKGMLKRSEQQADVWKKQGGASTIPMYRDPRSADAIDCGKDVEKAVRLLGEGKAVQLHQPRQVSVLLERLGKIAQEAKARGESAPTYDLCKVTVKGTSLFCAGSTILGRNLMPQLKTDKPRKRSKASKLSRNRFGEVDLTQDFIKRLRKLNYKMTEETEHAAKLKATQNELNGVKTANIMNYVRDHPDAISGEGPLIVTDEGYILDGHHRWAALVGLDLEDGRLGDDKQIPILRVSMSVTELLFEALRYTIDMGIEPAGFHQGTGGG